MCESVLWKNSKKVVDNYVTPIADDEDTVALSRTMKSSGHLDSIPSKSKKSSNRNNSNALYRRNLSSDWEDSVAKPKHKKMMDRDDTERPSKRKKTTDSDDWNAMSKRKKSSDHGISNANVDPGSTDPTQ